MCNDYVALEWLKWIVLFTQQGSTHERSYVCTDWFNLILLTVKWHNSTKYNLRKNQNRIRSVSVIFIFALHVLCTTRTIFPKTWQSSNTSGQVSPYNNTFIDCVHYFKFLKTYTFRDKQQKYDGQPIHARMLARNNHW